MKYLIEALEENPIIPGLSNDSDMHLLTELHSKIVFVLYGDITNIGDIVQALKNKNKIVFVNVDMIDGFSSKNSVIKFMKQNTLADGIISSKTTVLRFAKELGFYTVHRFFIIDSLSYKSIDKQLEISKADMINIVPGWSIVVEWAVQEHEQPVIASGLVCEKKLVIDNLKAGAIAICSTNHDIWDL